MSIGTETISIHALREEGDPRGVTAASLVLVFLSTPSARRATCVYIVLVFALGISIHALREEGDARISSLSLIHSDFYPRPPRGGRPEVGRGADDDNTFLSTPSARRATPALGTSAPPLGSISIHALREEGDQKSPPFSFHFLISIHALREEGDPSYAPYRQNSVEFLSTPSARRATPCLSCGSKTQ